MLGPAVPPEVRPCSATNEQLEKCEEQLYDRCAMESYEQKKVVQGVFIGVGAWGIAHGPTHTWSKADTSFRGICDE